MPSQSAFVSTSHIARRHWGRRLIGTRAMITKIDFLKEWTSKSNTPIFNFSKGKSVIQTSLQVLVDEQEENVLFIINEGSG